MNTHGMPIQVIIAQGTTADCTQATHLMKGLRQKLLADRGYDSNAIANQANLQGMEAI